MISRKSSFLPVICLLLIAFAWAGKHAEPQKHFGRSLPRQQDVRMPQRSLDELYTCPDTPIAIPDVSTIVAVINVPESYNVEDVDVGVTITHPWVRDLQLTLERDSTILDTVITRDSVLVDSVWQVTIDTTITPIDTVASVLLLDFFPGDNIVNMTDCWFDDDAGRGIYEGLPPFTGGFRPLRSLDSMFAGHDAQGEWRLRVRDRYPVDVGVLESFSIEINGIVSLTGIVTNSVSGAPIANATVFVIDTTEIDTTGADTLARSPTSGSGAYSISRLNPGTYRMIAAATNYDMELVDGVMIIEGQTTMRDFALVPRINFTDVSYTGNAVGIPDSGLGRAVVELEVAGIGSILDLDVTVNLTHSYVSDLIVSLAHPNGDTLTLFNPPGGVDIGDDIINCRFDDQAATPIEDGTAPYTGSFRPEDSLARFNGREGNGTWSLRVQDYFQLDTGQVQNYILHFQSPLVSVDERETGVPQAFRLHPAYPNPFNASVSLSLDVLHGQDIELTVFDITGRLTATLHSGKLTAGSHRFYWAPLQAASGMYFVRASTLDAAQTIKIVLLK